MDVDGEHSEGDLFENEADAMDEDDGNPGESTRGGDEDPPDDDSNEAGDENPSTVPKPKARKKVTKQPHKVKPKHPVS